MRGWLYFGCGNGSEAGHYLFGQDGRERYGSAFDKFDGLLAPMPERELYVAALSRLGCLQVSALSWWDRSVDSRPGSNSIIFAPTLTLSAAEIIEGGQARFPWVFARLPRPISLTGNTSN